MVVHPCYPHLGASPDGIVICDCCGKGVLEIKCPYSCRGKAFSVAANQDKDFGLQKHAGGHLQVIESHAYYKVQAQLKLCETVYCDFVKLSMDEFLVLQIFPDPEFIDGAIEEVSSFSSMVFCQNYWESGTPSPHSTATRRHLQIFMGIKHLMIHVKTVALAVTNGVIVEGQRKDK